MFMWCRMGLSQRPASLSDRPSSWRVFPKTARETGVNRFNPATTCPHSFVLPLWINLIVVEERLERGIDGALFWGRRNFDT